ncbi:MAG: hypothetical protein WCG91_02440 [Candidatus Shapirobacteria bacterium]
MQKSVNGINKLVFFLVFGVFVVVFLYGEMFALVQMRGNGSVKATNLDSATKILIGNAKNNDKDSEMMMSSEIAGGDARPMLIKKYLEKYNSPLAPYSNLIFELSERYGYEYYWIVAIAQQESNLCKKVPEESHNCWGYGINKAGTLKFDNYELALKSYAEYLKREYFDKGRNTTELIMKKYCPSSNGSWANGVNQFIEEMKSGDF